MVFHWKLMTGLVWLWLFAIICGSISGFFKRHGWASGTVEPLVATHLSGPCGHLGSHSGGPKGRPLQRVQHLQRVQPLQQDQPLQRVHISSSKCEPCSHLFCPRAAPQEAPQRVMTPQEAPQEAPHRNYSRN